MSLLFHFIHDLICRHSVYRFYLHVYRPAYLLPWREGVLIRLGVGFLSELRLLGSRANIYMYCTDGTDMQVCFQQSKHCCV